MSVGFGQANVSTREIGFPNYANQEENLILESHKLEKETVFSLSKIEKGFLIKKRFFSREKEFYSNASFLESRREREMKILFSL